MDTPVRDISTPGRIAGPDEGITLDELLLASRNHAMPLEAMGDDLTPIGLHYVLVHYDIPRVDADSWRLELTGMLEHPLSLDLQDLRAMAARTIRVTMECAGNGRAALTPRPISQPWLNGAVGTADWTGIPLRDVLERTGLRPEAHSVVFTAMDHGVERGVEQDYERALPVEQALADDVLLAYEMNGAPLPPQHGHPVRLVVPGWYGMAHVKWLRTIAVLDHAFEGFQNAVAYRLRQHAGDPGEPVTRINPRALVVPPGFPDFQTRARVLRPGAVTLEGRAWSGWAAVERVEVSVDDGTSWHSADLEESEHPWAWRRFTFDWSVEPGRYAIRARAADASGRVQPTEQQWNAGGFANNADQPVEVLVTDS